MKIIVDRDRCIGAGLCVLAAPEAFDQDDDGVVVTLAAAQGEVPPEYASAVARAVAGCPSGALRRLDT